MGLQDPGTDTYAAQHHTDMPRAHAPVPIPVQRYRCPRQGHRITSKGSPRLAKVTPWALGKGLWKGTKTVNPYIQKKVTPPSVITQASRPPCPIFLLLLDRT